MYRCMYVYRYSDTGVTSVSFGIFCADIKGLKYLANICEPLRHPDSMQVVTSLLYESLGQFYCTDSIAFFTALS
jgi:hypothetical protein